MFNLNAVRLATCYSGHEIEAEYSYQVKALGKINYRNLKKILPAL